MTVNNKRTIKTIYYRGRKVVKQNRALHPENAVLCAVEHLHSNKYQALTAEIFDEETGVLYAVIRRGFKGINILFKYDFK